MNGQSDRLREPGRLRLAYCGFPNRLKGFGLFESLAAWNYSTQEVSLYWVGSSVEPGPGYVHVPFRRESRRPQEMADVLQSLDIDAVVVAPVGFETYSLVTYEAIASGARVLTTKTAGHIPKAVRHFDAGFVFDSHDTLSRAVRSERFRTALRRQCGRKNGYSVAPAPLISGRI
jgi:hypothetical protein